MKSENNIDEVQKFFDKYEARIVALITGLHTTCFFGFLYKMQSTYWLREIFSDVYTHPLIMFSWGLSFMIIVGVFNYLQAFFTVNDGVKNANKWKKRFLLGAVLFGGLSALFLIIGLTTISYVLSGNIAASHI